MHKPYPAAVYHRRERTVHYGHESIVHSHAQIDTPATEVDGS
jgi:hypothetical protein